jgi:phospholipid-translocating P-type ATPase (flippase)
MVDNNKNEVKYIATSPDDLELVKAASKQGFKLVQTSFDKKTVIISGKTVNFEILNTLNFSSERKRMSIIFRDQNGKIKIYTKGADSEIIKRLSDKSRKSECFKKINNDINYFSDLGYRTLMIAYREIDEDDYIKWREKLHLDDLNIQKKHKIIEKYYDLIEKDFEILGATIVEDKLQDKVPETIKEIKMAGIKFWVLTGDKMSTAENIGFSCNLLSKEQQIFKLYYFQNDSERMKYDSFKEVNFFYKEFQKFLKFLAKKYNYDKLNTIMSRASAAYNYDDSIHDDASSNLSQTYTINFELFESLKKKQFIEPYSIIIEAPILIKLFRDEEQTEKFLSICYNAESVLCCRVSPFQKSQIVQKMKQFDRYAVTLAIGDGGNDVSMIMEANIGIGITGEEGMSAANASDFAIGEFKLLKRLLFYHGRVNLNRISKLILYFFYKNIIFTISQLFFCPLSLSSGQTIIDDWYITCYNLVFTAIPLCVTALTDFDLKEEDGKQISEHLPELYKESRDEKKIFGIVDFIIMIVKGIIISAIMFTICISNKILNNRGNISDLWYLSLLYYLSILFVVTNHLFLVTQYIIFLLPIVVFITTFLLLFAFLLLVHYGLFFDFKSKASIFPSLGNISFYLYIFFLIGLNIIVDYYHKARIFYYDNSLTCQLERTIKLGKKRKSRRVTFKEEMGIKKSNSINIEHSRLSLVNNNVSNVNNIISQHDKISFFNKNNLSKINDLKMSCITKPKENNNENRLSINYNNQREISEYEEDKSDMEEDECDKE